MLNQSSTNESQEQNILCRKILDGLKSLERIIAPGGIGEKILEVGENGKAESQENAQKLMRLSTTVEQYADRSQDLFYVGLMGHFSAGKSSTINSILGLCGEEKEARNVDNNPTDKIITLLTSSNNLQNLIPHGGNGKVPIGRVGLDNNLLLEKLVLADTPGSGDPSLQNAMIRDFMPVCDLILYFISAAIPLDEADLPLLKKKHEKLPFIPLKFVITRADEFKLDNDKPLSEENFDQKKVEEFKSKLLFRIGEVLSGANLTNEDLILIDNRSKFRTEILISYITELTNTQNIQVAKDIHSHKIDYFRSSANEIKSYFLNFVSKKIDVLSKLVETANKNSESYNDAININNNKMTENWSIRLKTLEDEYNNFLEKSNNLKVQLELTDNFFNQKEFLQWKQNQYNLIHANCETQSEKIYHTITKVVSDEIEMWYEGIKKNFNLLGKRNFNISGYKLRVTKTLLFEKLYALKLSAPIMSVKKEIFDLETLGYKLIEELEEKLQNSLSEVTKMITENHILEKYDQVLDTEIDTLKTDVERYFSRVEIYRAGVFSRQVRDYISSLRIGRDLDGLDIDIGEEYKNGKKLEAIDKVLPEYKKHNFEFKNSCAECKNKVINFSNKVTDIKSQEPEQQITKTIHLENFFISYEEEREEWFTEDETIKDLVENSRLKAHKIVEELEREVYASSKRLGEEIANIQEKRKQKIKKYALIFGFVPLIFYVIWQLLSPVDQSTWKDIGISIGTSLIAGTISSIVTSKTIRIERDEKKARKNNIQALNKTYKCIVDSVLDRDDNNIYKSGNIKSALTREWNHRVDALEKCDFMIQKEKQYNHLKENYYRLKSLCQEYTDLVNVFCVKYCTYFRDREKNLKVLNEIADEIKKSAITPSFDMLKSIEKDLLDLKKEIENVQHS